MPGPQKKWTDHEQDMFLEMYHTRRRNRGMGKLEAKIDAQKSAVDPSRHYTEGSIKNRTSLPPFVVEQIDIMEAEHMAEGTQPWSNPRAVKKPDVADTVVTSTVADTSLDFEKRMLELQASNPEIYAKLAPAWQSMRSDMTQVAMSRVEQMPPRAVNLGGMHFLRTSQSAAGELMNIMKAEVVEGLQQFILTEIDLNFNKVLDYLTDPATEDGERITIQEVRARKKIVIVGLLNKQFETIKMKFPKMRLQNIEANQTGSKLPGAASGAELVIVMTDWVSHDATEIAKKYAPGRVMNCTGQMSMLSNKLNAILNEGM